MLNINNFLSKILKNINKEESDKILIKEIIKNYTGIDVVEKDIEVKNNIVYLNSGVAVLNKVFINKKNILNGLNKNLLKITDIR